MNYTYKIKFFKNKNFLVEEVINDKFKYMWTDIEIYETLIDKHYYHLDVDAKNSLNRIVVWLIKNHAEWLI